MVAEERTDSLAWNSFLFSWYFTNMGLTACSSLKHTIISINLVLKTHYFPSPFLTLPRELLQVKITLAGCLGGS